MSTNKNWTSIESLEEIIYENKYNYILLFTEQKRIMIGKIHDWSGIYTIVNEINGQNLLNEIEYDYDDKVTHFMICKI